MPTTVAIDPHAVLALADLARAAADQADDIRTGLLQWFDAAWLDGTAPAGLAADADEGLTLLAQVLRARANLAAYPMPGIVGATLHDDVRRADTELLTYLGPDPARVADGRRAAHELAAADGQPADDLVARIRAGAADPSFALGFTSELGIDGAGAAIVTSGYVHPDAPSMGMSTPAQRDTWAARHAALLEALGQTYATASLGEGAFAGAASDPNAWVTAITAQAPDALHPAQGGAVALLTTYGRLAGDVLAMTAVGVYAYERANSAAGAPLWEPRSQSHDRLGGARTPEGLRAYDPMASLLTALGADPFAAQTFLMRGPVVHRPIDGTDRVLFERLTYLFEDRRWPTDDGAGFGAALAAATTERRDGDTPGVRSAQIASQVIAIVALNTGRGAGGWGIFHDDGWYAPEGTRRALAQIVASYMPDVFTARQADGPLDPGAPWYSEDNPGFPPNGPYGLATTKEMLATVIQTIGTNPTDAELLLAAVLTTEQLRLGHAARQLAIDNPTLAADLLTELGGGGDRRTLVPLANAASQGADVLGFVVHHAYVGDSGDDARAAAAQQRWADLLKVAIALPIVPTPAGPWGRLAMSQGTTRLFDAWQTSVPTDATGAYGSLDEAITVRMEQLVLNTLAAEGLLRPAEPIVGYEPPPDAAFVFNPATGRPSLPLRFDVESDAYLRWSISYKPTAWVNGNLTVPYLKAFPRIG